MARLNRLCIPGWPHLLMQRVHEGLQLARDDIDRSALISSLASALDTAGCALHAYTVLDDRFVLLLTPDTPTGLSRLVQAIGRQYVARHNRRHGRGGGLWAGRFRATVLDPAQYLLDATVFIETLALRTGLAHEASTWKWSSCAHHLGQGTNALITDHALFWQLGNTPFERQSAYARRLQLGLAPESARQLETAMQRGWALGSDAFLSTLTQSTQRPLKPRPRGRPRKLSASGSSTERPHRDAAKDRSA